MHRLSGLRAWVAWLLAGTLVTVGYLFVPVDHWLSWVIYDLFCVASVVVILLGIRRHRPAHRLPWLLFAAGLGLWNVGELMFTFYFYAGQELYPSPADIAYCAGVPLLITASLLLVRGRARGSDRSSLIDASIVSTGVTLLGWVYVIGPLADDPTLSLAELAISVTYPACDLLLLCIAIRLLTLPGARTGSYWLITGALVSVLVADTVFTTLISVGGQESSVVADVFWMLTYLLWSAAALHPGMARLADRQPARAVTLTWRRLAVLGAASLLAPAVLAEQGVNESTSIDWAPITLGAIVLFLLVITRMGLLIRQTLTQADQLAVLANRDALTGIANRRCWDDSLPERLREAQRTGRPVTVALLDLDHFKRYNDTHGHPAGDALLHAAASAWQAALRPGDLLARYGGEEFGLVLDGLERDDAALLVEYLRQVTPLGQTVSVGVAIWDGTETVSELAGRADAALYAAKAAGRDTIVFAPSPSTAPVDEAAVDRPSTRATMR
ncbi:GGDEF domain-containing protein [Actinoplanes flavus]|uniref:GGDEF domain-containing protein n=1 Tax=Actinoplanes flavus TaxID=2820290 RepID=A0ABS3UGE2_9ACTN|nr:GGDEF domain-containing protein [Actinoplanes flavus]MBO3736833.1 GGDEF domain-containing protein [Actinoplanes flavus]